MMSTALSLPAWLSHDDNQTDHLPVWFAEYRQRHRNAFLKNGLPKPGAERWKYTDLTVLLAHSFSLALSPALEKTKQHALQACIAQHRLPQESILLVMVNGYFMPEYSDIRSLPKGVMACRLQEAMQQHPEWIKKHWSVDINTPQYPFASLNAAMGKDGLFFFLPEQCELSLPLHILSIAMDESVFMAHPYHLMILDNQSKLTLLEEHIAHTTQPYWVNQVTQVCMGQGAELTRCKIQKENTKAIHMAHTFIQQQASSRVTCADFSVGAAFARDDIVVKLSEKAAHCLTCGFYAARGEQQYVDHHIEIDHRASHSSSEMFYKGVIDHQSRAVFNGRLYIEKEVKRISAYQANHHLLLSQQAEAYSKPELEIYADDVQCKHGATTGQLDQDALFYLRSRGIEQAEARRLLLQGFAQDVLQRVSSPCLRKRAEEAIA